MDFADLPTHARSLPPLSAIVSSSLTPSQWGPIPAQSVFPFPQAPPLSRQDRPPLHVLAQLPPRTTQDAKATSTNSSPPRREGQISSRGLELIDKLA
ncbi:hypothetical protein BGW80DRAFT_1375871 [Lactifluus volemus]|nr:hypothetical protein BGW80DRAFT_1415384 [Lactifluus volemus]KAH9958356.1 hypothetical protein BGW80DRAFT_1375871 [Lactifluus volemus]